MQDIIRWIGMIIIVISMIIALVYGTIEAIDLVKELALPEASQPDIGEQVDIQTGSAEKDNDGWRSHLKGISLAGLDIAVLATAWFEGKEYYDDLKNA